MIRDYFERKRICLTDNKSLILRELIALIIAIMAYGFIIIFPIYTVALEIKEDENEKIYNLLPLSKSDKKKIFITDQFLNFSFFVLVLMINVCVTLHISGLINTAWILHNPLYGAVTFISYIVTMFHWVMERHFTKGSCYKRLKEALTSTKCSPLKRICEAAMVILTWLTYSNFLIYIIMAVAKGNNKIINNLPVNLFVLIVGAGVVFMIIDTVRILGGKNEY